MSDDIEGSGQTDRELLESEQELQSIREQLSLAQKQNAEKDEALCLVEDMLVAQGMLASGQLSLEDITKVRADLISNNEKVQKALYSTSGQDYVHKSEVEKLVKEQVFEVQDSNYHLAIEVERLKSQLLKARVEELEKCIELIYGNLSVHPPILTKAVDRIRSHIEHLKKGEQ